MGLWCRLLAAAVILLSPMGFSSAVDGSSSQILSHVPSDFSVPDAMRLIYGNLDSSTQMSVSAVPGESPRNSSFDRVDKIDVRPFFIQSAKDSGIRKIFFLSYAVPDSDPLGFDCHGCAPLIGMTVLVKVDNAWRIESSNKGVVFSGQWGHPSDARILRIGRGRVGIELKTYSQGGGYYSTEVSILIPWKGEIRKALNAETEDDDRGECGDGYNPCYRNRRVIHFVKGADPDYYDIVMTRSGTALTEDRPAALKRVDEVERRHFSEGKYILEPK